MGRLLHETIGGDGRRRWQEEMAQRDNGMRDGDKMQQQETKSRDESKRQKSEIAIKKAWGHGGTRLAIFRQQHNI